MTLIQTARKRGRPYNVKAMEYSDFYDLKDLASKCGTKFNKTSDGETVRVTDIKVIKFQKQDTADNNKVFYKSSYTQQEFKEIGQDRRFHSSSGSRRSCELKGLYDAKLQISDKKKGRFKISGDFQISSKLLRYINLQSYLISNTDNVYL